MVFEDDQSDLFNLMLNPNSGTDMGLYDTSSKGKAQGNFVQ